MTTLRIPASNHQPGKRHHNPNPTATHVSSRRGGSPYSIRDTAFLCSVKVETLLEKAPKRKWTVDGRSIAGYGDKIHVTISAEVKDALQFTTPILGGSDIGTPQKATCTSATVVDVTKTIQVEQADGTRTAPVIFNKTVQAQPSAMADVLTLEVEVTDSLGQTASDKVDLSMTIFGDKLADAWKEMKTKYEQLIHPDDLIGAPDEKMLSVLVKKFVNPTADAFAFKKMDLAINIKERELLP